MADQDSHGGGGGEEYQHAQADDLPWRASSLAPPWNLFRGFKAGFSSKAIRLGAAVAEMPGASGARSSLASNSANLCAAASTGINTSPAASAHGSMPSGASAETTLSDSPPPSSRILDEEEVVEPRGKAGNRRQRRRVSHRA